MKMFIWGRDCLINVRERGLTTFAQIANKIEITVPIVVMEVDTFPQMFLKD